MDLHGYVLLTCSVHGNIIGKIVAPLDPRFRTKRDLLENSQVNIGLISDTDSPDDVPENDVNEVIDDLVQYLKSEGMIAAL